VSLGKVLAGMLGLPIIKATKKIPCLKKQGILFAEKKFI
tara:strand:+ start:765 stop:881 length:117 start_codon:yes stop_codon:yes gene_type:complete